MILFLLLKKIEHKKCLLLSVALSSLFSLSLFSQADSLNVPAENYEKVSQHSDKQTEDELRSLDGSAIDTLNIKSMHSPGRATLMSALLPGLGQVYNKKYWKVPIIYIGGAVLVYFMHDQHLNYLDFDGAYDKYSVMDNPPDRVEVDGNLFSVPTLKEGRDYYRRNRDLFIISISALYLLNVIDANVDAHFFQYDVSEDLSLRIEPSFYNQQAAVNQVGLRLSMDL